VFLQGHALSPMQSRHWFESTMRGKRSGSGSRTYSVDLDCIGDAEFQNKTSSHKDEKSTIT